MHHPFFAIEGVDSENIFNIAIPIEGRIEGLKERIELPSQYDKMRLRMENEIDDTEFRLN